MAWPAEAGKDNIFRSAAFLAAASARAELEQAELEAEAARRNVAERAAKVAEYESAEADRLLDVRSKEMRSRVQAARNRLATLAAIATEIEAGIATLGATWAKFQDELKAFQAVCPPDFNVPEFSRRNLIDLWEGELLRGTVEGGWALPHAAMTSTLAEPLSSQISMIGREACDRLPGVYGIRPRKGAIAEDQP